jgi:RNA polymerase sigma factor (sigma-70 family)
MSSKPPFEAVVELHGRTVLRVCRAVVGTLDADDAWSETFLSAMRAYPSLPDDANIEAWLVTIAHRKATDIGRARSHRAVPTDSVIDRADRDELTHADLDLVTALAVLPDKQRQSVAYHYLAGLHTLRSPRSWVGPRKRHDARPPTGSRRCDGPPRWRCCGSSRYDRTRPHRGGPRRRVQLRATDSRRVPPR